MNLPVGELAVRLIDINALRDKPVTLVCRTDKRSANAAVLLREAGFRGVRVMRGGMEAWNRNGLPVQGRTAADAATMSAGGPAAQPPADRGAKE